MSLAFRHSVERDRLRGRREQKEWVTAWTGEERREGRGGREKRAERRNEVAQHVTRVILRGGPSSSSQRASCVWGHSSIFLLNYLIFS